MKAMSKTQRHEAIRARATAAIADLYHNATLPCMREMFGRTEERAQGWLGGVCESEIDYLRDGGASPGDYRATLAAPCNAGRYKSERARAYYIRKGMRDRDMERAHCGTRADGTRNNAYWELIGEYGKLYQYGRGGRTLAPADLVRTRGGSSFGVLEDYPEERSIEACVRLIQVLESFNRYVGEWCASVPEQWRECCESEDAEIRSERARRAAATRKENRERAYWAARDVVTA